MPKRVNIAPAMTTHTESSDDFNALLAWLNPDSEAAALTYETIRADLMKIFRWRGCSDPEGLADETIIRVTRKVGEMAASYTGSPVRYFYGVAKNVLHEYDRKRDTSLSTQPEQFVLPAWPLEEEAHSKQRIYECFEKCLKRLEPVERKVVVGYYEGRGRAKIEARKRLASRLKIDLNGLRVRTGRIRARLRECIEKCLAADVR